MNINDIELQQSLMEALERLHISAYSRVQQLCIPHALQGEDIFAQAPTGSGKTYAYVLPILEKMTIQGKGRHMPQALILCPTRELSLQTASVIRTLLEKTEGIRTAVLTGGVDMNQQVRSFSKGADIVIGTPARINDHIRRHTLKLAKCSMLVLDEADVMLKMGFLDDVTTVIETMKEHQTMLFSATYSEDIKKLAETILHDPYTCEVQEEQLLEQKIEYTAWIINEKQKLDLLMEQLNTMHEQVIVFTNTRRTSDFVCGILKEHHFEAETIHSEMDPVVRKEIMLRFRNGRLNVLVATDVVSRGIDIPAVADVISYDMPALMDTLVHRFGRTARAGTIGKAYVYLNEKETSRFASIQEVFPSIRYKKRRN